MRSRYGIVLLALSLIVVGGLSGIGSSAASHVDRVDSRAADATPHRIESVTRPTIQNRTTITGVSLALTRQAQQRLIHSEGYRLRSNGYRVPDHVMKVYEGDGTEWLVFTEQVTKTAATTISGVGFEYNNSTNILLTDTVTYTEVGQPVSLIDYRESPTAYSYSHIKLIANYTQITTTRDVAGSVSTQNTVGVFGDGESVGLPPGRAARTVTINHSGNSIGATTGPVGYLNTTAPLVTANRSHRYWLGGETAVSGVVAGTNSTEVHLSRATPVATEIDGIDELRSRGEQLQGEIVTVEAAQIGTRTASQEYLETVAGCGPDSVTVPVSQCVGLTQDVVIHTGVLVEDLTTSPTDAVPYVGLSNARQNTTTQPKRATVRLTGRVVSTSRIDPSLDGGYGLMISERTRLGGGVYSRGLQTKANTITSLVQRQLNSTTTQWQAIKRSTDRTPTPTTRSPTAGNATRTPESSVPTPTEPSTPSPTPATPTTSSDVTLVTAPSNTTVVSKSVQTSDGTATVTVTITNTGGEPKRYELQLHTTRGADTATVPLEPDTTANVSLVADTAPAYEISISQSETSTPAGDSAASSGQQRVPGYVQDISLVLLIGSGLWVGVVAGFVVLRTIRKRRGRMPQTSDAVASVLAASCVLIVGVPGILLQTGIVPGQAIGLVAGSLVGLTIAGIGLLAVS